MMRTPAFFKLSSSLPAYRRRDDDGLRRLIGDDKGRQRRPPFRIEDDAHGLMRSFLAGPVDAAGQERIIGQDRIDTDQDAVVDRAQVVP